MVIHISEAPKYPPTNAYHILKACARLTKYMLLYRSRSILVYLPKCLTFRDRQNYQALHHGQLCSQQEVPGEHQNVLGRCSQCSQRFRSSKLDVECCLRCEENLLQWACLYLQPPYFILWVTNHGGFWQGSNLQFCRDQTEVHGCINSSAYCACRETTKISKVEEEIK